MKELLALAVKKSKKKDKVMSVKMSEATYLKLKLRDIDVAKTVQAYLEYLAVEMK